MQFLKPIDENSTRHLFNTEYVQNKLKLRYVGPALSDGGDRQDSPDCLVLDVSSDKWDILRAEFKFIPENGASDFSHNGQFDLAIIWDLTPKLRERRRDFEQELKDQNGCRRLILIRENIASDSLVDYTWENINMLRDFPTKEITDYVLAREAFYVWPLLVAAKISPNPFKFSKMIELLDQRFPEVRSMTKQGKANVLASWSQKHSKNLIEFLYADNYAWTKRYNAQLAAALLTQLLTDRFRCTLPSESDITSVI
jgi:hypothetical protein